LSDLQAGIALSKTSRNPTGLGINRNQPFPGEGKLIAAFGNSMRADDAAAGIVLERLAGSGELPDNIQLRWHASPINLLSAFISKKYKKVIIVDAIFFNHKPGDWIRLNLNTKTAPIVYQNTYLSIHSMDLIEVLELCLTLNIELPDIVLYGVQPKEVNFSRKLSDAVQNSIPDICIAILEDIKK
jgi:hydrogenase maturation protease